MSVVQFRGLLLSAWLLSVAAMVVDVVFPELLPDDLHSVASNLPPPVGIDSVPFAIVGLVGGAALIFLVIATSAGLWLFQPWARSCSLWATIITVPLLMWAGPGVSSGVGNALNYGSVVLWGAVLAVAYWSPLAVRFERR
jgi:hypothetical protein